MEEHLLILVGRAIRWRSRIKVPQLRDLDQGVRVMETKHSAILSPMPTIRRGCYSLQFGRLFLEKVETALVDHKVIVDVPYFLKIFVLFIIDE